MTIPFNADKLMERIKEKDGKKIAQPKEELMRQFSAAYGEGSLLSMRIRRDEEAALASLAEQIVRVLGVVKPININLFEIGFSIGYKFRENGGTLHEEMAAPRDANQAFADIENAKKRQDH